MTYRQVKVWWALAAAFLAWPLAGCGGDGGDGGDKPAEPAAAALRPAYSPDGTKIAFTRVTDDGRVVYVMNADGTDPKTVTPLGGELREGYESPSFSPDGKRLVVAGDVGGIFVIGTDGTGLKALVDDDDYEDREPTFSPDGTKIAWLRTTLGSTKQDDGTDLVTHEETALWIMDADGSHQKRLAASAGPDQVGPPAFSHDGTKIAYVVENSDAKTLDRHLWVMNADGTGAKALTSGPEDSDWDPSFSPDQRKIVFAGIRGDEVLEVYAMDADGTDPAQLTTGGTYSEDPSYSPDGKHILFTSQRSGSREVWVMNADGTDQRQLTTFMPSSAKTP